VAKQVFDLGGNDFGVLTYAYALEQLEADFYTKVTKTLPGFFIYTFNDIKERVLTSLFHHSDHPLNFQKQH
jgi:hypothetical protein